MGDFETNRTPCVLAWRPPPNSCALTGGTGTYAGEKVETFSVVGGRGTMLVRDISNRRLIVEIGNAPVRPAEFVIFRIV
jgi:phage tail sheath protein FI